MLLLLIFFLIIYFGYLLSNLIIKDLRLMERLGLAYLLGIGLTTLLMFFYSWAGIQITLASILTMLLILTTISLVALKIFKKKGDIKFVNPIKLFNLLKLHEKIVFLLITVIIGLSFLTTLYYPVNAWDAIALYDFRAKVIAQTGYFVQVAHQFTYFAQYPLLTSLTHTIVYLSGGNNPQFTYSLYFICFALVFYSAVRRGSNRFIALLATVVMVTNPRLFEHSTIAYTNLPYTVFYALGIIYLYFSVTENRYDYLLSSSLLIGLSTWARSDLPFWATGVLTVLIYAIYKKSLRPILIFLPVFLIIQQTWNIYQTYLFGAAYSTSGQLSLVSKSLLIGINFGRVTEVASYIYQNIFLSWGAMFILFVIFLLIDIKNRFDKKTLILMLIIIFNLLILFIGTYIFSLSIKEWREIADSAKRMSMFFPPLMFFYSVMVFSKHFIKNGKLRW